MFVERVKERLNHPERFVFVKNLRLAYKKADEAHVPCPKVYAFVPHGNLDLSTQDWKEIYEGLPNIFTVRPSIFFSQQYDFMMRDDGIEGLTNIRTGELVSFEVLIQKVVEYASQQREQDMGILLEEFPLLRGVAPHYPVHYRTHMFYDKLGCVQFLNGPSMYFCDDKMNIMKHSGKDSEFPTILETHFASLRVNAEKMSVATRLPYVRIDWVLSNKGPMFRSYACTPGDVRSTQFAWFYGQYDNHFSQLWDDAERKINGPKDAEKTTVGPEDTDSIAFEDNP